MSQEYIEISEKNLDDAITVACQKLSVTSDRLDYTVVDQGSNGFLGFNARNAVIKARIKDASEATESVLKAVLNKVDEKSKPAAPAPAPAFDITKATSDIAGDRAETFKATEAVKKPEKAAEPVKTNEDASAPAKETEKTDIDAAKSFANKVVTSEKEVATHREDRKAIPAEQQLSDDKVKELEEKAEKFLTDVFGSMGMKVNITMTFDKEWNTLAIDMAGDDMGILIGKRGQTLDSLQYLISLVVNKGSEGYIHVKADTEDYRERRKETLEKLARNIAYKVKHSRHSVELEPMNPYERRIIHSALQNDRYVTTHSEGEEPYRKVVVTLKK